MKESTQEKLSWINQLIFSCKYAEAQNEIQTLEKSKQLAIEEALTLKLMKSTLFYRLGKNIESLEIIDQLMKDSAKHGQKLIEMDSLILKIKIISRLGHRDDVKTLLKQGKTLIKNLDVENPMEMKKREADLRTQEGNYYLNKGDLTKAEHLCKSSLVLARDVNDEVLLARASLNWAHLIAQKGEFNEAFDSVKKAENIFQVSKNEQELADAYHIRTIILWMKGEYSEALNYNNRTLEIREKIGNKLDLSSALTVRGAILFKFGEFEGALENTQKSLAIYKAETSDKLKIGVLLNNIACAIGQYKGDCKTTLELFNEALVLARAIEHDPLIAEVLYESILLCGPLLSSVQLQEHLKELKALTLRNKDNLWLDQQYRLAKALILKTSDRLIDKATAQKLFQEIADEKVVKHELTIDALLNLSEMLIEELQITGSEAVLTELENVTTRIQTMAKKQHSYWLIVETYILQSRLALVKLDLEKAKEVLIQAQIIAEEKRLQKLVDRITHEHYQLFEQLEKWEEFVQKNIELQDRIEQSHLEELIVQLVKKRIKEIPKESLDEMHQFEAFQAYLHEAKQITSEFKS